MAFYLGKLLNLRPRTILETWCVPELIVTYGNYANEAARKNFEEWKSLDAKQRAKYPRPPEYAVYFRGVIDTDGN